MALALTWRPGSGAPPREGNLVDALRCEVLRICDCAVIMQATHSVIHGNAAPFACCLLAAGTSGCQLDVATPEQWPGNMNASFDAGISRGQQTQKLDALPRLAACARAMASPALEMRCM